MDNETLMLAVEVRKIAEAKYVAELAKQPRTQSKAVELALWQRHNSVMTFVPEVIEELNYIGSLLTQPPQ